VRVGAEVLDDGDRRLELRQRAVREGGVLEGLRPDADDDALVARRRAVRRRERDPVAAELDRVAGEPRLDQVHRRRTDEGGDEEVVRVAVEVLRRVDLLQAPVP
jgi:hypothetical protein